MSRPSSTEKLLKLLDLERIAGRRRRDATKDARCLDLDILLVGNLQIHDAGPPVVRVPHPHMTQRRFVLAPLADVMEPDTPIPGADATIGSLLATSDVATQGIECVALAPWF